MKIPKRNLEKFARELADECLISLPTRTNQYDYFTNYYLYGADEPANAAIYNKTFAYMDDLESLLYSPVSLRFQITNPQIPNVIEEEKGRVTAEHLRSAAKASDTDTTISGAVLWSLVKGRTFIKQTWKRKQFSSDLVQPEYMGVLRESYDKLDEDMEAFVHRMWITPFQFERMISEHPDASLLRKRAKRYISQERAPRNGGMAVTTSGFQPFQAAGAAGSPKGRGTVDWLTSTGPMLSPHMAAQMLPLDELWVWDDDRRDWTTFQIVGDDMLIMGKYNLINALAWNQDTGQSCAELQGRHPFTSFCPNSLDGYFWGRSETVNVAMLQEAINARINGTNKILRKQEDPPKKFIGSTGVNQKAVSRFNKPGGYWVDGNPNAKVEDVETKLPADLWATLHEYERMFDEMGGLPPIARGRGEAGVRSQGHAETLVRMFSPRFKDRALLVERSVAEVGTLMFDLARVHEGQKQFAWVPRELAGAEAVPENPLIPPPAEGLALVPFLINDLDDAMKLSINSHSSSPAFAQDAKALIFDLFKIGGASAADVVEHTDTPDPDGLLAGIRRREVEKAKAAQAQQQLQLAIHHKGNTPAG